MQRVTFNHITIAPGMIQGTSLLIVEAGDVIRYWCNRSWIQKGHIDTQPASERILYSRMRGKCKIQREVAFKKHLIFPLDSH